MTFKVLRKSNYEVCTMHMRMLCNESHNKAYSQSRYPKGQFNKKKTSKDHFGFLLHLLFHDYGGLVYDYN